MQPILIDDPDGWDEFVSALSLTYPEDEPLAHLTAMIHCVNQNKDKEKDTGKLRMSADLAEILAKALRTRANAIEEEERDYAAR